MTIKISQLGNLTAFTGNTLFPVVDTANAYITVKSTGSTLLTYIAGNLTTLTKDITVTGNVTATNFYGNGSQLTGMNTYSNVQVATYLPTYSGVFTAATVQVTTMQSSTGNIQSNISTALTVAGGVVAGNVTTGIMSATAVATNFYNEKINFVNVAATSGYNLSNTVTNNILLIFTNNPTATINMPAAPVDGDVVRISANANVVLAVGTGTVQPSFAGANVLVSPLRYIYSSQYAKWIRI
jgi:hypothetical protein